MSWLWFQETLRISFPAWLCCLALWCREQQLQMGATLKVCSCWEVGGSCLRIAADALSPRCRRLWEVKLGLLDVAEQPSVLLQPPSAAQLREKREALKSRGGLCCSEEPDSGLVGRGSLWPPEKFVLAHFPVIWLQESKSKIPEGKISSRLLLQVPRTAQDISFDPLSRALSLMTGLSDFRGLSQP